MLELTELLCLNELTLYLYEASFFISGHTLCDFFFSPLYLVSRSRQLIFLMVSWLLGAGCCCLGFWLYESYLSFFKWSSFLKPFLNDKQIPNTLHVLADLMLYQTHEKWHYSLLWILIHWDWERLNHLQS
jgi:hypothetical protein